MRTINNIRFTPTEKDFLIKVINYFGTGQHPVADEKTIQFFNLEYIIEIFESKEFQDNISNLNSKGKRIYENVKLKIKQDEKI